MTKQTKIIPKIGERVEFASRFVPKCNRLLDIGCGDCVLKLFVKDKVNYIYGIDNDKQNIKVCQKRYGNVDYLNLDQSNIPYQNNYFDCITCLDVIEHVIDPDSLVRKIFKVLKPEGYLILSTPNIRFSDHIFTLLIKGVFPKTSIDKSLYDGGHLHFFTFKDIRLLLIKNNFQIIKEEGIINKSKRGIVGQIFEVLLGKKMMLEFRSPGIMVVAKKI